MQPLLSLALRHVAHPTIRNRGTTVGSIVARGRRCGDADGAAAPRRPPDRGVDLGTTRRAGPRALRRTARDDLASGRARAVGDLPCAPGRCGRGDPGGVAAPRRLRALRGGGPGHSRRRRDHGGAGRVRLGRGRSDGGRAHRATHGRPHRRVLDGGSRARARTPRPRRRRARHRGVPRAARAHPHRTCRPGRARRRAAAFRRPFGAARGWARDGDAAHRAAARQRGRARDRRAGPEAAVRRPAPRRGAHRHARRVRARRVRVVHGAARRQAGAVVPAARRHRAAPRDHHGGGPR